MNGVCVIYDTDEMYAKRLMNRLIELNSFNYGIMLFTQEGQLLRYLNEHKPELLLISEGLYNSEVNDYCSDNVIIITDNKHNTYTNIFKKNIPVIYKYQKVTDFIKQIERILSSNIVKAQEEIKIIGIYTPVEEEQRSVFSLELACVLSEKSKVLYISFDDFSGLREILKNNNTMSLSDIIYICRQNDMGSLEKCYEAICTAKDLDYILPVVCAEDVAYIEPDKLLELLRETALNKGYNYIVIDIGQSFINTGPIINNCDCVFMPVKGDYISQQRIKTFEEYIASRGLVTVISRIKKVVLPKCLQGIDSNYFQVHKATELYGFTRGLI